MHKVSQVREALKSFVFGPEGFRHRCDIGLLDPQAEVSVWLHGWGAPRDVTYRNVIADARPLTIGIGLDGNCKRTATSRTRPSLKFHERGGASQLLGEIGLKFVDSIPLGREQLNLFEVRSCTNHCLPKARLWSFYLFWAWQRWRSRGRVDPSSLQLTALESHCLCAFYICPRPVVLVSVVDGNVGNIFPMDLIGPIGTRCFSLALSSTSTGVPLMERSRRIALSSVALEQTSVAYELGKNHKKPGVAWEQLPFATTTSAAFGLPVPQFSLRVQEMQIAEVRPMGSHKLFICNTIEDQCYRDGLQLFIVHGFYRAWRQRERPWPSVTAK
jgi:flavin reductase (DIM6/NTAB) family NADH-FMN oxidoreductase RutF